MIDTLKCEQVADWFNRIEVGVKPDPLMITMDRGTGKSTAGARGIAQLALKKARQFALCVAFTQEQADYHVSYIGTLLSASGLDVKVSRFGSNRGWRREQVETTNGFIVAGIGADTLLRGVKIDEFRPGLIWVDDYLGSDDTADIIDKKAQAILRNVLPARSDDCAVIVTANAIGVSAISQPGTIKAQTRRGIMTDVEIDLTAIERAADNANTGLWIAEWTDKGYRVLCNGIAIASGLSAQVAVFMAVCDPATVKAMTDRIHELERSSIQSKCRCGSPTRDEGATHLTTCSLWKSS